MYLVSSGNLKQHLEDKIKSLGECKHNIAVKALSRQWLGSGEKCRLSCGAYLPFGYVPYGFECHDTEFGIVMTRFLYAMEHEDAKSHCSLYASFLHLPTPANSVQNEWYHSFMKSNGHNSMWLGIKYIKTEAVWKTDKGDLQTYTNWDDNEPNDDLNFDRYVEMTSTGNWNNVAFWNDWVGDQSSSHKNPALCTYIVPGTAP